MSKPCTPYGLPAAITFTPTYGGAGCKACEPPVAAGQVYSTDFKYQPEEINLLPSATEDDVESRLLFSFEYLQLEVQDSLIKQFEHLISNLRHIGNKE